MNIHKKWNYFINEFRLRNEKLCSFIDTVIYIAVKIFKNIPTVIAVIREFIKIVFKGLFKLLLSFLGYLMIFLGSAILVSIFVKTVMYFL